MNILYNCSNILGETETDIGCVYSSKRLNMSIYIHSKETDDLYIKVFNSYNAQTADKCCRIKIFKAKYKNRPYDDYRDEYILNEKEKENLVNILNSNNSSLFGTIDDTLWNCIIKDFLIYNYKNKKMKKLLLNAINNIPDYKNLLREK